MNPLHQEALRLLEETLKELESPKGSVCSAVQKLLRASELIENEDVKIWCSIQMGDVKYTHPLTELFSLLQKKTTSPSDEAMNIAIKNCHDIGIKDEILASIEEIKLKGDSSGSGYTGIGFIEEQYADLVCTKKEGNGIYHKIYLSEHINYVRRKTHEFAANLFKQLKFAGTIKSSFEVLKEAVDDRLLDLNPSLAEQLMLAFKAVSSDKNEEWSQALTTCRRLLEGLADEIFPATDDKAKGRPLGQAQYVNRLWAFMDAAIQSESNKELAKAHIDFLGSWIEKTNKLFNKGVHSKVQQLEAVKAVFHTYLVIADILEYLSVHELKKQNDINAASIDELEILLEIPRTVAKAIIKKRIEEGYMDLTILSKIHGVGKKTLEKAKEVFFRGN